MEKAFSTQNVKTYLKLNWLKITLLGLICFVCLKKDLSFQFNLNSPLKVEDPVNSKNDFSEPATVKKKPKAMTQKELVPAKEQKVAKGSVGLLDRFELPFFGSSKKEVANAEHGEIDEQTMQAYLQRFAHVAMSEQKKYGIPASIILSNALFHSFAGQRDLVIHGNNHFAIPCNNNWDGERATYQGKCYRHYDNAWSSFRDHSLFLTTGKYRKFPKQHVGKGYRDWAYSLEKAGFSDRRNLAKNLISLIEDYDLQQYDF